MTLRNILFIISLLIVSINTGFAQISPGDLSKAHAHLEGASNCTQCHAVGNKVTREKCLACHQEIKNNIDANKGYHASKEVKGKNCAACHNDHHGRDFQLIKFNKKTFNHSLTGFVLKGQHAKEDCASCHNPKRISDPKLEKKSSTYLGLNQKCLSCHDDFHQSKMSANCAECHNFDSWKNAKAFDHSKTRFPLRGKHQNVKCIDCHKTEIIKGKKVQKFSGLAFANCNACHKDVHENRFGQDCKKCHTEESFHKIKGINNFDHDKTAYKLVGKHKLVDCKACHKTANMTDPLKHDRCTDCHKDEHDGQFAVKGIAPDCKECHSIYGFKPSEFSIERHNKTNFKLDGAHLATSCNQCHKKEPNSKWKFRSMGTQCIDCHKNEHEGFIGDKFMPDKNCAVCHNTTNWKKITFDHDKTGFKLEGEHAKQQCGACHYRKNETGIKIQKFRGMTKDCTQCHKDSHAGQFAENGKTDCLKCHKFTDWKDSKFDHNNSRFKIDGEHIGVECNQCHKTITNEKGTYIEYKYDNIECSLCHK